MFFHSSWFLARHASWVTECPLKMWLRRLSHELPRVKLSIFSLRFIRFHPINLFNVSEKWTKACIQIPEVHSLWTDFQFEWILFSFESDRFSVFAPFEKSVCSYIILHLRSFFSRRIWLAYKHCTAYICSTFIYTHYTFY